MPQCYNCWLVVYLPWCWGLMTPTAPTSLECAINLTTVTNRTLLEGDVERIGVNCSCCIQPGRLDQLLRLVHPQLADTDLNTGRFFLRVVSHDREVVLPARSKQFAGHERTKHDSNENAGPLCTDRPQCAVVNLPLSSDGQEFYLDANSLGWAVVNVTLVWANISTLPDDIKPEHPSKVIPDFERWAINSTQFKLAVLRKPRLLHTAFDWSAAFIAGMITLSVGCCTDPIYLIKHLKRPLPLALAFLCQHILIPTITFGICVAAGLANDHGFGLFAVACVPGGGLAHLIVFLIGGDRELSAAISTVNIITNLGTTPVWLLTLGHHFNLYPSALGLTLWMGLIGLVHVSGILLRHCNPAAAQGVMTWFTRPLLLLSGILLITLGVYINHYVFHHIDYYLILSIILVIFGGFLVGALAGAVTKQTRVTCKTLAAEAAVYNSLILIPALRTSLAQPDGDLTASVPLWTIFLTPLPVLLYFAGNKLRSWGAEFVEKRKEKQIQ